MDENKSFFDAFKEEFKRDYEANFGQEASSGRTFSFRDFHKPFTKKRSKKILILIPIFIFLLFYFTLPAINPRSYDFWRFLLIVLVFSFAIIGSVFKVRGRLAAIFLIILLALGILHLSSLEIFNAKRHAAILQVTEGDFSQDIDEIDYRSIPTIDRDSAIRLGNREMGELVDLVSQFNLDESYTQINYDSVPVRVTPLEYNGLLKWLTNFQDGIPSYMLVNMVNGEARLVPVENNIKYSHSDMFFRDIRRHVRFSYPTKIIKDISFEVDEAGIPYWVTPTYRPRVGWFGAQDVEGVITTNASTGENSYYELGQIPSWVDRAFESRFIMDQLGWYGKYQDGFWNSQLAQKGVLQPTQGYNYLAIDDDIYLYTGITSVAQDSSNIGFVLVNLRTKETKLYRISSADEVSAMASAEGEVQEKDYQATFPILLNIEGKPTYFLSLKDNAGLIKMYAFIDAQNYQEVSTGNTVRAAYLRHLGVDLAEGEDEIRQEDIQEGKGTIEDIYSVVVEGNSHYYFTLQGQDEIYVSSIKLSDQLPFLKAGDQISFSYADMDGARELISINLED